MSSEHLDRWVNQLRLADPRFAEASVQAPITDRAWQSATYLLTASPDLWAHFGPSAIQTGTLEASVTEALALHGYTPTRQRTGSVAPSRYWRTAETDLLVWSSFCWTDSWFEGPSAVPRACRARSTNAGSRPSGCRRTTARAPRACSDRRVRTGRRASTRRPPTPPATMHPCA